MTGIQYITDEQGHKTAVVIDLKTHGALWEDVMDAIDAQARSGEESIFYEQYRAQRNGKSRSGD